MTFLINIILTLIVLGISLSVLTGFINLINRAIGNDVIGIIEDVIWGIGIFCSTLGCVLGLVYSVIEIINLIWKI